MFVRWERRSLEAQGRGGRHRFDAILVEEYEKSGQFRERVLKHLASIEERFLNAREVGMRQFYRGLFWVVVDKNLNDLNLEPATKDRIETEILQTVPRPNEDWGLWAVTCVPKYDG
jgi:hypothetical protein